MVKAPKLHRVKAMPAFAEMDIPVSAWRAMMIGDATAVIPRLVTLSTCIDGCEVASGGGSASRGGRGAELEQCVDPLM